MPISETAPPASVVHDLERDGVADVFHADEDRGWLFSGLDGAALAAARVDAPASPCSQMSGAEKVLLPVAATRNPVKDDAMSINSRPRLLIAEDHAQVRDGLRILLNDEFDIIDAVADGQALLEAAARAPPDAVVLDISMPRLNGIEAATRLVRLYPGVGVVFITNHTEPEYLQAALEAGAHGYVIKTSLFRHLIAAVHAALEGQQFVSPLVSLPSARG
ncbi:MAG TPA: response regulator transcription factor [Nannocystis sp.]|jgi:CheY-like chemotaxis protein